MACIASKARRWSQDEIRYLRQHVDTCSYTAIARALSRSRISVICCANKHGLSQRKRWTEAENRVVREREAAGDTPAQMLAHLPGRTLSGVYQLRLKLGLARQVKRLLQGLDAFIREKHAQQWSDAEIRDAWNASHADERFHVDRRCVGIHRTKLDLPPNDRCERRRRRVAAKTLEQCAAAGVANLGELRAKIWSERAQALARQLGWPQDLLPREVQILTAIWDRGPMTRRELCEAIGMPWKGIRHSLRGNRPGEGGTYTAQLIRRGLLVRLRRAVPTGRRGGNVDVYTLPLNIQRRKVESNVA